MAANWEDELRSPLNSSEFVEAIPLGGLGEFGMNMMVLRYGDQMIIIDSGLMFPDEELLGIELSVKDFHDFVKANCEGE